MIGSVDKKCNQTTGQCNCKDGVTGLRCDRCLQGYRQTQHASIPCKSIKTNTYLNFNKFHLLSLLNRDITYSKRTRIITIKKN